MPNSGESVCIGGRTYRFCSRIAGEPKLLESFHELTQRTFQIHIDSVGGDYEPHVLAQGDTVCANVSVNKIPFLDRGRRRFYIQLGTVMTREGWRGRGLSRWLMQAVLAEWEGRCDALYLFANDSVLDFYPRFGFAAQAEHEFVYERPGKTAFEGVKLSMARPGDAALAMEKYRQGSLYSDFAMTENLDLYRYYANGLLRDSAYHLERHGVVVFADFEPGLVRCYDILGRSGSPIEAILRSLRRGADDRVILGFTPRDTALFVCRRHEEPDTTLMVHRSGENRLAAARGMFPFLSRA
ncbi:GNAT family N-acetyltransferase [Feifania hominis]|uniref:GNAT family N-acetyltransferase n=1 Tax=Feifania hominis TaxID=2763660 RepID=A0A926DG66_9FIRM|nr:GNAT family N-acetyltransferase [Feifania hominis]MBC8537189.1 GNAT family N-acetyltransferase [Feifania hominis]